MIQASRLLLYIGFTLYTSAFADYYSAQTFVGNGALTDEAGFLNILPGGALIGLGLPLLVSMALLRWRGPDAEDQR